MTDEPLNIYVMKKNETEWSRMHHGLTMMQTNVIKQQHNVRILRVEQDEEKG